MERWTISADKPRQRGQSDLDLSHLCHGSNLGDQYSGLVAEVTAGICVVGSASTALVAVVRHVDRTPSASVMGHTVPAPDP